MMRRLPSLAAVAVAAAALTGCATRMTVSSHIRPGTELSNYRTYAWGPADALPTGDARLDANPFFKDHLQGAVEKRLATRGFVLAEPRAAADLLLHYHASINRRIDVNRADSERGYYHDDSQVKVIDFEAGTIVLDVMDGHTNLLLWRGWAQTRVEEMLRSEDKMAKQIDEAAGRMLERLPFASTLALSSTKGGRK